MRTLIPLLKLDSFFPEEMYLEGETMYDEKRINLVSELYRGKALVVMSDESKVEIRFNKDNIVDVNCNCDVFKIKKLCPHLVAGALEVRKLASKMQEKKVKRKPRTVKKTGDRLKMILNNLSKAELESFVSSYAQKDKNFRLFFEAFFMNKLKSNVSKNNYGNLLDEILPPSSDVETKFSRQQIKLLCDIASDLTNQYKDSISLKKYTDAFQIIKSLLNKLSYAYNSNKNEKLEEILMETHDLFFLLFDDEIAPELKENAYEFVYEMIQKSYYFYQKDNDLIHLLLSTSPLKENIVKLIEVLNNKIQILRDKEAKSYLITFYIGLEKRYDLLDENWFDVYFNDMTDFMDTSVVMIKEGFSKELEELLKDLYAKDKMSKRLYLDSQLKIALSADNCERVGFLAKDIYENTSDFKYIKRTRHCISDFSDIVKKKLTDLIREKGSKRDLLNWYQFTEQQDDLINFLKEKNDIYLIKEFENYLLENSPEKLQKLYYDYMKSYLENHFGKKSSEEIKQLLFHLRQIGAKKVAFNIEKDLFEDFGHRKRLLKDLMGF